MLLLNRNVLAQTMFSYIQQGTLISKYVIFVEGIPIGLGYFMFTFLAQNVVHL